MTYKSRLLLSCQNLSQNDWRSLVRSAETLNVRGRTGGWSCCVCGNAISRDGLEQLPTEARDNEPRCVSVPGNRDRGVSGDESPPSSVTPVVFTASCGSRLRGSNRVCLVAWWSVLRQIFTCFT